MSALKARDNFKKFVDDEIFHASQKKQQGANHSHSGTNAGGAQSIVKAIEENPTVFVKAGDMKETLVLFNTSDEVIFTCVIDSHQTTPFTGIISIE